MIGGVIIPTGLYWLRRKLNTTTSGTTSTRKNVTKVTVSATTQPREPPPFDWEQHNNEYPEENASTGCASSDKGNLSDEENSSDEEDYDTDEPLRHLRGWSAILTEIDMTCKWLMKKTQPTSSSTCTSCQFPSVYCTPTSANTSVALYAYADPAPSYHPSLSDEAISSVNVMPTSVVSTTNIPLLAPLQSPLHEKLTTFARSIACHYHISYNR
jgi:hypothetical protein